MAMRSAVVTSSSLRRFVDVVRRTSSSSSSTVRPYSSDGAGKGRLFSEEEKAAENIYIKKMEKEKWEKMKQKGESEKAKENADKKTGQTSKP